MHINEKINHSNYRRHYFRVQRRQILSFRSSCQRFRRRYRVDGQKLWGERWDQKCISFRVRLEGHWKDGACQEGKGKSRREERFYRPSIRQQKGKECWRERRGRYR